MPRNTSPENQEIILGKQRKIPSNAQRRVGGRRQEYLGPLTRPDQASKAILQAVEGGRNTDDNRGLART